MSQGEFVHLPSYAFGSSSRQRPSLEDRDWLPSPRLPTAISDKHSRRWRYKCLALQHYLLRPRIIITVLKVAVPCIILLILGGLLVWEPHIELAFYSREWIQSEIEPILPLSDCFRPERVSPLYNVSEAIYGLKQTEVQAGLPLRLGMDCYDFAGTIQDASGSITSNEGITFYHTYWRSDLAPFGTRQEWMLKSFFATQNTDNVRLILWSNGDLSRNSILDYWLRRYPEAFELRIVDYNELARGTELAGSELLMVKDSRAWIDGDLVRLLVLWAFGGVWVDMDSLLTRDLSPLLDHEFVTQWDCYDKMYSPFNGALMRFRQHSPYLCEAFHIMTTSQPPRKGTTDWGSLLYLKLWRRLVAASIPPFKVLPFCFSDGRSCRLDNRLPDPFTPDPVNGRWTMGLGREEGGGLDKVLGQIFSIHLHNQWEKVYPIGGWVERLLLQKYEDGLARTR
ncbi:uncharacterized protein FIBRA_00208 [Fibroporia radiculosa]|uniref:Glycosyltransferase family 32 protein n=1 Tax=Fibroporia radiculosa TaxID=599839 RepID=J7S5T7_9APHY|nr:uncharacterized protein FIBRA_00208 [Fibroporia radiculosa]CCL98214.1 predicted protein [Fibroporia radiculosa]